MCLVYNFAIRLGDEDNNSVSSNPPYPILGQSEALNLEMNNTSNNTSGHRHGDSIGKHYDRKLQLEDMLSGCTPNKRFKPEEVTIGSLILLDHVVICCFIFIRTS